jgi:hypothetical protein
MGYERFLFAGVFYLEFSTKIVVNYDIAIRHVVYPTFAMWLKDEGRTNTACPRATLQSRRHD